MPQPKTNKQLLNYIIACRNAGYEDWQIRQPLYDKGWEMSVVEEAFYYLRQEEEEKIKKEEKQAEKIKSMIKSPITIHLTNNVLSAVEKRAKKNMLSTEEQIADIVRRSTLNQKKQESEFKDNIDDKFIALFSRKTAGKQRKDKAIRM